MEGGDRAARRSIGKPAERPPLPDSFDKVDTTWRTGEDVERTEKVVDDKGELRGYAMDYHTLGSPKWRQGDAKPWAG